MRPLAARGTGFLRRLPDEVIKQGAIFFFAESVREVRVRFGAVPGAAGVLFGLWQGAERLMPAPLAASVRSASVIGLKWFRPLSQHSIPERHGMFGRRVTQNPINASQMP